jgi:BirA family biotin operon repressor/biotin-[acetyl-CoA-carboxylase] ligase
MIIATESLSIERIRQNLTAQIVGRQLYLFGEVSSTNSMLARLARGGAREGTVVVAEGQTAGRGRLGKAWFSPAGVNLYASTLFRPPLVPSEVTVFSFIASLALFDAIQEEGAKPAIKWPNDVLVSRKKVAGVLAEAGSSGEQVSYVILGVGVNLNIEGAALTAALGDGGLAATSLCEVVGREIDRSVFTGRFLTLLDEWFQIYSSRGARVILQAWRDREITTGRRVEVREEPERFDGRVLGVNGGGHLVVQDAHKRPRRVVSGEIRFLD